MFAVNVKGVWATTDAAIKSMGEGGRIVTVESTLGSSAHGAMMMGSYIATKAALQGCTHAWAKELGSKGITVNLVQPGPINTDLNPDIPENPSADGQKKGLDDLEKLKKCLLWCCSLHQSPHL
jgi:3-oxoacyl-[acyl-carrier protein] reductase